jgi:hypothetical protein
LGEGLKKGKFLRGKKWSGLTIGNGGVVERKSCQEDEGGVGAGLKKEKFLKGKVERRLSDNVMKLRKRGGF